MHERDTRYSWKHSNTPPLTIRSDNTANVQGFAKCCKIFKTCVPISLILASSYIPSSFQDACLLEIATKFNSPVLYIREFRFIDQKMDILLTKIRTTIQVLNFEGTIHSDIQCKKISEACLQSSVLRSLTWEYSDYTEQCFFELISRGQLTEVDFMGAHDKNISFESFSRLCDAIRKGRCLTKFHCYQFLLGDEKSSILLETLTLCDKLEDLDISLNKMGDVSMSQICELKHLQYLNISGNRFTDISMEAISQMISRPGNKLRKLNMTCCDDITDNGMSTLIDSMESSNCVLSVIEMYMVDEAMANPGTMERLLQVASSKGIRIDV